MSARDPRTGPPEPSPPPLWDWVTFKAAGAATLAVGLIEPIITGEPRDWRLVGLGLVFLGGRELVIAVAQVLAGRGGGR